MKESDGRRVGSPARRLGAVGILCDACLSLVSTGVCERERGHKLRGRERTCVATAGRIGGGLRYGLYILLSLPLVSKLVGWAEC